VGKASHGGGWVMSWRRPVLIVFVSVMELSWLYPWLALLGRIVTGRRGSLNPVLVFALYFLVLGIVGLLDRWRVADRYQRIVVGGFVLATTLLMIRMHVYPDERLWSLRWIGWSLARLPRFDQAMGRELFMTLITFAIWWRGLCMQGRLLLTDTVGLQFRLGILLLIGLLIAQALSYRQDMTGWMLSLFLCGLVSVALARFKEGIPTWREAGRFNVRWLSSLLLGAVGTLLIGLLVSALLSAENLATIWKWLRPVTSALCVVLFYVVLAVTYVLVWLINGLFQLLTQGKPIQLETTTLSPLALPAEWRQPYEAVAPAWAKVAQQGLVVLVVVGLFLLLLTAVRRWRFRPSGEGEMWRESVWSSKEVGQGLLQGLQGSLRQLAGLLSGREAQRAYSMATVRKIYASLLVLAEQRGISRPPAQTPLEYLPELRKTFPSWGTELRALTRAYVDAHYGQLPDTEAELQALRDAWQRIHTWAKAHTEE
jgi:hypothetical protein